MKPIRQDTGVFDAYFLMAGSVAIPARWSTCARSARQAVELDRHGVCDEQDSKAPSSHSALPVPRSVARRQLLINRAENDRLMPGAPGCAGFPHRKNAARSRIRSIDSRMTRRTGTAASMRGSSHNRCWSTAACPSIWPASRTPCGPSLSCRTRRSRSATSLRASREVSGPATGNSERSRARACESACKKDPVSGVIGV